MLQLQDPRAQPRLASHPDSHNDRSSTHQTPPATVEGPEATSQCSPPDATTCAKGSLQLPVITHPLCASVKPPPHPRAIDTLTGDGPKKKRKTCSGLVGGNNTDASGSASPKLSLGRENAKLRNGVLWVCALAWDVGPG